VLLVVIGGVMVGGSEYWTGTPRFCRSCHIMEPYYLSWSHDIHGAKLGVRCVDCHYAPGERFTFHAKFKGLSQATSYFSGRAGASRPRAHVSDASCMTQACHGDRKYEAKKLLVGEVRTEERIIAGQVSKVQRTPTVGFVHNTHLDVKKKIQETQDQLARLTATLKPALAPELFARLEATAASLDAPLQRAEKAAELLTAAGQAAHAPEAREYVAARNLRTRLLQLDGLTCAACHGYDASSENHFAVDRQTCYTCHFTNQGFNAGTGTCLKCHEPPTRQILIHGAPTTQGAKPSIMDHRDILARNIDCASCHLDVVAGRAQVSARECAHCHDRASYLKDFERRTTETVEEYHRVHVAAQRARCPDCHGTVRHQLVEPSLVATSEGFVKTVLDECQHCHPGHHTEQVKLLMGVGGKGVDTPMPNAMFGSRLNCRACHQQAGTDFKGAPLIEATAKTCIACHDESYGPMLQQWVNEIKAYVEESEKALAGMDKRMEAARAAGRTVPPEILQAVELARHNIQLIRAGNGIHNRNFATHLLDRGDDALRKALEWAAGQPATQGAN
jgi:nitrate/TMAO reductase-like tetraheme cytochrome c subunit